jgi:molecular chaperone DnaK
LASERKQDSSPLQGLKNTLGSLKDELFADDEWDDWDSRGRGRDPWAESSWGAGRNSWGADDWSRPAPVPTPRYDDLRERNGYGDRYDNDAYDNDRYQRASYEREPQLGDERGQAPEWRDDDRSDRYAERPAQPERRTARPAPFEGDPWAED